MDPRRSRRHRLLSLPKRRLGAVGAFCPLWCFGFQTPPPTGGHRRVRLLPTGRCERRGEGTGGGQAVGELGLRRRHTRQAVPRPGALRRATILPPPPSQKPNSFPLWLPPLGTGVAFPSLIPAGSPGRAGSWGSRFRQWRGRGGRRAWGRRMNAAAEFPRGAVPIQELRQGEFAGVFELVLIPPQALAAGGGGGGCFGEQRAR